MYFSFTSEGQRFLPSGDTVLSALTFVLWDIVVGGRTRRYPRLRGFSTSPGLPRFGVCAHVYVLVPLKPDHDLQGCALIHRRVARWNAIEIDCEIEHGGRIEPSGQHIGEQLGKICPNRCPPTSEGDMAKKEPHQIDLFDAMGHPDVADASSWTGDGNGGIHRLLRADALHHRFGSPCR